MATSMPSGPRTRPSSIASLACSAHTRDVLLALRPNALGGDVPGPGTPAGAAALAVLDVDAAMSASATQRRLAEEAAGIGHWDWDIAANSLTLSREASAMLGVPVGAPLEMVQRAWPRLCHPEDREELRAALSQAMAGRVPVLVEIRVRRAGRGNEYRWLLVRGHQDTGARSRMLGELIDVTDRRRAQTEKVAATEMFRRVTEAAPGLLYVYDLTSGAIRYLNHGYADYAPDGALEGPEATAALMARVHPEDAGALLRHRRACLDLQDREVAQITFRIRHRDGSQRWLSSRDTPFARSGGGRTTAILCSAQDVTEIRDAAETLQHLTRKIMTMQDDERRRIARDLHDQTAQNLLAASLALKAALDRLGPSPDIEDALHLIDASQREIRTLSYLLHPPLLDEMGLQAALGWYADGFSKRTGILVHLDMPEAGARRLPLPVEAETAMFRVAQEALTNAYRHANPARIVIALSLESRPGGDGIARLCISDDGHGMKAALKGAPRTRGLGLASMSERMRAVGGRLMIRSCPGQGCTIEASSPIVQSEASTRFAHEAGPSPHR